MIQALVWSVGTCALMLREKFKWRTHKGESTDAGHRGGITCSSEEASVMEVERRGYIDWLYIWSTRDGRNQ